ncbi:MAG: hypothetical protein M3N52_06635, partial [Actinomycetota bacterium]|nr:hypothetical protein [Actinomycetota bacterium]
AALLAPGLVQAAAYAALRSPPEAMLLLFGDVGAQLWVVQALGGLERAWMLTLPPAVLAAGVLAMGAGPVPALLLGGAWALASAAVGLALLRWWLPRRR